VRHPAAAGAARPTRRRAAARAPACSTRGHAATGCATPPSGTCCASPTCAAPCRRRRHGCCTAWHAGSRCRRAPSATSGTGGRCCCAADGSSRVRASGPRTGRRTARRRAVLTRHGRRLRLRAGRVHCSAPSPVHCSAPTPPPAAALAHRPHPGGRADRPVTGRAASPGRRVRRRRCWAPRRWVRPEPRVRVSRASPLRQRTPGARHEAVSGLLRSLTAGRLLR
jgi:hypothetical protein